MSIQLVRQGIRLRADERSRWPLLDVFTDATPQGWVRAATQFEVALARGGMLVDVGNLASVTLEAAPFGNRNGARVFSRTLAGSALDNTLSEPTWTDGSKQHALFTFSSTEMNVALGGKTRVELWLVVSAVTSAGQSFVCGTGKMVLVEDGVFGAMPAALANAPATYLTVDQSDARYARSANALNFAPGVVGVSGGGATKLDGLATVALPNYYALLVRESSLGLSCWVLEPDADSGAGTRSVVPLDHDGSGNARTWRQRL